MADGIMEVGQRELLTSFLVRCLRKPLGSPALTRPGLPQVDYREVGHETTAQEPAFFYFTMLHSNAFHLA
jgi:hypothetical protein